MSIQRRISHLSFQSKVLIPVLSLLVALPAVTVYLVNQHVEKMTLADAGERLTTAEGVLSNSLEIRQRSLQVQFKNVVHDPRFKAVARLNDDATIRDYLTNYLLPEVDEQVEVLVFTSFETPHPVSVRRSASIDLDTFESRTLSGVEAALGGGQSSDFVAIAGVGYDVLSLPAYLSDGKVLLGCLTIGVRLSNEAVEDLKSLTHTELILAAQGEIIGSSLPRPHAEQALAAVQSTAPDRDQSQARPIVLDDEHFHLKSGYIAQESGKQSPIRYIVLSSYESSLAAQRRTQTLLLAISIVGIGASVLVIWILVRRITSPLRSLKEGAEAVGQGDFSRRVECDSNDECGALARSFNRMTSNLQTSRQELESTVSELRATQIQLIQREARLRESEEGLRLIIEGARDHLIFTLDNQGRPLRWNSASERILGYSAREARSLDYGRLFDESDRQADAPDALLATARDVGQATFEGWRVRKDGSRFWADVTLSRLAKVDGAEGGGFVEIARDITARREAEVAMREARDAAESSDRAKSEFLANMSHEFRTPMNGIIGMSGLLANLELSDEQSECVDSIRYSAESLLAIIDDILDIAKIEAGQLEITKSPANPREILEECLDLFADECASKSLELRLLATKTLPAHIETDANRLRQVIVNVVGNAVKFTQSGSVTVTADYDATKGLLRLSVRDTGIGIPHEKIARLFSPFYQVESSAARQFGGTGLGLTISRNIVELLGGAFEVESEVGRGSCFTFTIQAATPSDASPKPPLPLKQKPPPSGFDADFAHRHPLRILVVEDNPINTKVLVKMLKKLGYTPDTAGNGEEGLRAAESAPYDTVLMDLQMPVMDGLESARRILASETIEHPIYISACTANARQEDREACQAAGMHDFVSKPARIEALTAVLERSHQWAQTQEKQAS